MRTLTLTFLASLALACERDPQTPYGVGSGSAYDRAGEAKLWNPRVIQFEDVAGLLVIDPATGLFSIHVASAEPLECTVTPTLHSFADLVDLVDDPDDPAGDRIRDAALPRGVYLSVFSDWSGWRSSGYACVGLDGRKIAEGFGQLAYTDGDLIDFLHRGAEAFGFEVRGRIELDDDRKAGYLGHSRCAWDAGRAGSIACDDRIRSTQLER